MSDVLIIFRATMKVIEYFFPAILAFIIGLGIIAYDEKRDKHKKRPFRRQSEKVQYK